MHARLCANLDAVHCRLACCIGSVVMHVELTSIPATLLSRAVAEPQQVTIWPLRIWCFTCCGGCTVVLCQALALLCISASHLLVNHVLGSSCALCRHMLMQEVRATALDVVQDCTPGLPSQSSERV